jgi:hypothetical protein
VKDWLPKLLSELQAERLKGAGFRKKARTFSRDRGDYWERFNFQGSAWNGAASSWRFYVNVGIEFKDLPEQKYWSYFAHTHWAGRLEQLVTSAPAQWEYDASTERHAVKERLHELLLAASTELASRAPAIRQQYLAERR